MAGEGAGAASEVLLKMLMEPENDFDDEDKRLAAAMRMRAAKANLMKRPAAADADERQPKTLKRPSAATVMKRPAAPAMLPKGFKLELGDLLTTKSVRASCSEGAYTSKAHSMGQSQAKAAGLSDEDMKSVRRYAYGVAKAFWLKHK